MARLNFLLVFLLQLLAVRAARGDVAVRAIAAFNGTNGAQPLCVLAQGTNGNLYGTTSGGGAFGQGTIFVSKYSGTLTNLVSFDGTNGAQPLAGLVAGLDGNFYGTTSAGGDFDRGTVFSLGVDGSLTVVNSFDGTNGARPLAALLLGTNGDYYGTTSAGGTYDQGTVFSVTPAGELTTLFSFAGSDGAHPSGRLLQGSDGTLYGTTAAGGANGYGTVFSVTPSGTFNTLHAFTGTNDGAGPQAGLAFGTNGSLYGTTAGGGTNDLDTGGDGTVFSITTAGAFSTLRIFDRTNGASPFGELLLGLDGRVYGTTVSGGAFDKGTAFSITGGIFSNLLSFSGGSEGANPQAGLLLGTNGNLLGAAATGGKARQGTLYQISGFTPFFVSQPASQTVVSGDNVTFTVIAGGSAPLTYQWQFNSNNLANSQKISGVTTPTLLLTDVTPDQAGKYSVKVTDAAGTAGSANAGLTVIPRPKISIVSPRPNQIIYKSLINVSGRTSGGVTVARVYYQLNGGGWQLATTRNAWASWQGTVTLLPGTNMLAAYAESILGTRSPTNSVTNLSVTAFLPVKGSYHGLIREDAAVLQESSGFISLNVTEQGTFSGSLRLGAGVFSVHEQFDSSTGFAPTLIVPRRSPLAPLQIDLQLDLTNGTDHIAGEVTDGVWKSFVDADRAVFNSKTNKAPQAGLYTLVVPGGEDSSLVPGGTGYGTVSVDSAGQVRLFGSLADGTSISLSVPLSKSGRWPLYVPLYHNRGSLSGWLTILPDPDFSGDVSWIKPADSKAVFYPNGFTLNGVAMASSFHSRTKGNTLLNFTDGAVVFTSGGLADGITNTFTLAPGNKVINVDRTKFSLSFSASRGSFRGTVSEPGNPKRLPFKGVVLQNQNIGLGYFLRANESGQVLIQAN